ncbi:hypothetical protein OY671_010677, partial [Metschnikowia pulcherrima]
HYVPCSNDRSDWVRALRQIVTQHSQGWPTQADQQPTGDESHARQQRAKDAGAKA